MEFKYFFRILNINLKNVTYLAFFIVVLYENFVKLQNMLNPFKIKCRKLLHHWKSIQVINIPVINVRLFFYFYRYHSDIYYWLLHTMDCVAYSTSNTFSTTSNISMSFNESNSTPLFFKATCQAKPGAEINFTGSTWQTS